MSTIMEGPVTEVNVGKYSNDKFLLKEHYLREKRVARIETVGDFERKDTVEAMETVRSSLEECYSFSAGIDKVLAISGDATCTMVQEHVNNYRQMAEDTFKGTLRENEAWELWVEERVFRFMKHKSHINRFSKTVYETSSPIETKDVVVRTGKIRTKIVPITV
jgi:ribulose kinase